MIKENKYKKLGGGGGSNRVDFYQYGPIQKMSQSKNFNPQFPIKIQQSRNIFGKKEGGIPLAKHFLLRIS